MKAILVIEIPDKGLWKTGNDIYNRMKGYKCSLKPMPEQKDVGFPNDDYDVGFGDGWDACLKELEK